MPIPTVITDLSTTASSNYPDGDSESPIVLDDVQRAHAAFIAQLRDDPTANILAPIPVADGGTGAVTSAGAPWALKGSNSDITALTALASVPAVVTTAIAAAVPAGTIIDFAGTSAPSGYLACPLTATNISRATYAALFTAIGTTWGAGDGSTTFGCPWFPADYVGVQANSNVGTASVGVMPAHTHPLSITTVASYDGGNSSRNFKVTGSGESTGSTGTGTENLAAGHRVLKCVKL